MDRLHKIIAHAGIASRRKAEELISTGKVKVDGKVVTDLATKLDPSQHDISVNGSPLTAPEKKVYYLLHKPKGYVTTVYDPQNRPTVTDLMGNIKERIYPVGRLDLDSEGALILTNDGDFANRILHPSNEVLKTYLAEVNGHPTKSQILRLRKGIVIEGKKTAPAQIIPITSQKLSSIFKVIIHEGRKRQIRKMFDAIGYQVISLKRIAYGNLLLGTLKPGKYRRLTSADIRQIFTRKKSLYNR